MKFTEFRNGLGNGEEFSLYVFEGEDAYFRLRGLTLIREAFVSEQSLNYVEFRGDVSLNELLASLSSLPFMSKKRLTVVKEYYPDKKSLEALKTFVESAQPDSILAIVNERVTEGFKKFPLTCVVDCNKADTSLLCKWIMAECKRSGVSAEYSVASTLVEYCLNDMSRIEMETQKLISYVGKGGVLTEQAVTDIVSKDLEYKIYELTDYLCKKKGDSVLTCLNELLAKGETSQRILISIYNYFRRLLFVAISDKTDAELCNLLGIKEYPLKMAKQQSKLFLKKTLKKIVDLTSEADYNIKSGLIDQDEGLKLVIFKILTEENKGG